ncbi:deoxyguanosinetriphosphate triphosphohydrolase family protein [Colwellia sp. D2M02]|uniref:anti-phage deoxyguanosine triphosphatase n=1 Tax=Colwellia sp. D2M02 TaxID=2841562 RepID=UPI001C093B24|nr:anti-phage deoxyguanosine triphosphatase [Colwellia sp. D2M02]MBU2893771.1 deoxyguanosinetriphosphate triphosphohydrolase family protein [Colwellia sp. D2M02]
MKIEKYWVARRLEKVTARKADHRTPFQRDRARILHSASFRRLQSKTQIMGSRGSDFFRTRLTHSLEAAQIGSGITSQLRYKYPELCHTLLPDSDNLIESICLAHDIGHPPFGHGGEVALNYMMRNDGGFEGNGQTLRIVARLETFSESYGMNLTRRTLLGLMKYPQTLSKLHSQLTSDVPVNFRQLKSALWHPPKGLYDDDQDIIDWVLAPLSDADRSLFQQQSQPCNELEHAKTYYKSLDCSIMELADDIAYGIHDLEDAVVTQVISPNDFEQHVVNKLVLIDDIWLQSFCKGLTEKLFSHKHHLQKDVIGDLVNYLITAIELTDLNTSHNTTFNEPLLRYNATLPETSAQVLQIFKRFVFKFVIKQTSIQRKEYRGQQIVMELFEALSSDPIKLLPDSTAARWLYAKNNQQNHQRIITDYIAGMTDDYAMGLYQSLFHANSESGYRLS